MKRILLTIIISLVLVVPALADNYKCLVDLHPQAREQGLVGLGEIITETDGYQYRVMAECKHLENDVWLQFIDTTDSQYGSGELDNTVDFVIKFQLTDDEFYRAAIYHFTDIMPQLVIYCNENNIKIEDWVHFAKPLPLIPEAKI